MSTDTIEGVLRLEDGLPAVRFERSYRTGVHDLWDAVTSPERLARWFHPVTGDLREGGSYTIDFGAPGDSTTGRILRCDPPKELVLDWDFTGEPTTRLHVELREAPTGSVLVLDHSRLPQDQGAGYGAGWQTFLQQLDAELAGATTPLASWDDRYAAIAPAYRRQLAGLRGADA